MSDTQSERLKELVGRIGHGETLTAEESEAAFTEIMEGRGTPVLTAALLTGLRARRETAAEIAGGVRALQKAMIPVDLHDPHTLLDTCGTGGGRLGTFNISTAAALVAAGAGVRIAKHGNRSFTSRSGSADILAALGVEIELTPAEMRQVFEDAGIVFMFAPLLHPAIRHAGPVRKELGFSTIINVLGPLSNPARAKLQLVGVSDAALQDIVASALLELGHRRAMVVHGEPGMDELSPIGPSTIVELKEGRLERYSLDPQRDLGWPRCEPAELAGGEPADNARIVLEVLENRRADGARAAVVLNAGAAIHLGGLADTLIGGIERAVHALDTGEGTAALDRLRQATARATAARSH